MRPGRLRPGRWGRWAAITGMVLVACLGTLALYYSTLRPDWARITLAALYPSAVGLAFVALSFRRSLAVWAVLTVSLLVWYIQDQPSNNRDWAPEYAIEAEPVRAGRVVTIRHIRDFSYQSETDFTPAYYDASFSLDDLVGLDLVSSYWAGDSIAHVFLTFDFRDGRHLAFSIETRRQRGSEYSTLAGFFRHYELFYVVADERDVVGVRTDVRRERVYLYRLRLKPAVREALFLSYLDKVAGLNRHPEWYNTLTGNCTTGILMRANAGSNGVMYNWRVLVSGYAPEYAYILGLTETDLPFPDLRRESLIVRRPGAVIDADYSKEIRPRMALEKPSSDSSALVRGSAVPVGSEAVARTPVR